MTVPDAANLESGFGHSQTRRGRKSTPRLTLGLPNRTFCGRHQANDRPKPAKWCVLNASLANCLLGRPVFEALGLLETPNLVTVHQSTPSPVGTPRPVRVMHVVDAPERVVNTLLEARTQRVALLGLSFKIGSDDLVGIPELGNVVRPWSASRPAAPALPAVG